MPDQDVRRRNCTSLQQLMELVSDASGRAWQRTSLAPAESGAIVCACSRHAGDCRMNEAPAQRRGAQRGVEDDGGGAFADAVDVQTMCPDVDEPPWWPTGLRPHLRRVPGANAISVPRARVASAPRPSVAP